MPATWTDAYLNAVVDAAAQGVAPSGIGFVSAHTASPGAAGTTAEVSGGSYARVDPAWGDGGVEGSLGGSDQPATAGTAHGVVNVYLPAGQDATHLGFWAPDGTTFLGSVPLPVTVVGADATQQIAVPLSV